MNMAAAMDKTRFSFIDIFNALGNHCCFAYLTRISRATDTMVSFGPMDGMQMEMGQLLYTHFVQVSSLFVYEPHLCWRTDSKNGTTQFPPFRS